MPALLTSTRGGPSSAVMSSHATATRCGSSTCACTWNHSAPVGAGAMSIPATAYPAPARARHTAVPIAPLAPVTTATVPVTGALARGSPLRQLPTGQNAVLVKELQQVQHP